MDTVNILFLTSVIIGVLLLLLVNKDKCTEFFEQDSCLRRLDHLDIYLINLDRNEDRLDWFVKQYMESDLNHKKFKRVVAVDGKKLNIADYVTKNALKEIQQIEKTGYRTKHYQLTRGAIGCYLSHLKTYKMIADGESEFGLIFEDDVKLDPNFLLKMNKVLQSIPNDWDMLLLGCYCINCKKMPIYSDVQKFFLLHCYLVKKESAKKMYDMLINMPIKQQIDSELSDMILDDKLVVYCVNESICLQNNAFATDIQTPLKVVSGIDPYVHV